MRRALLRKTDYQRAAQLFHWATSDHYRLWFTGKTDRHKRTEVILPRLVRQKALVAVSHEGRLVYAARKQCRGVHFVDLIEHGLGCTEGLVRFWRSAGRGIVVPEKEFRGLGAVPEWGLLYPQSLLLYEFCTLDNFDRHKVETKVAHYKQHLPDIEGRFKGRALVLFVIDVLRSEVQELPYKIRDQNCFFVDYRTFRSVPVGQQLTAPIYIWGGDGLAYPLKNGLEAD